jgi:coenzyme F420-reducing hydrogenase beta subunit
MNLNNQSYQKLKRILKKKQQKRSDVLEIFIKKYDIKNKVTYPFYQIDTLKRKMCTINMEMCSKLAPITMGVYSVIDLIGDKYRGDELRILSSPIIENSKKLLKQ